MRSYGKSSSRDVKGSSGPRARPPLPERAHLSKFRVIQRDLVYIIGIPIDIAAEDILAKYAYFGQYGPIKKIVVNQTVHTTFQKQTVSAYVTFQSIDDAWECLYAFESFSIGPHSLKASFGTSKYCSAFLSGQKCSKPDCMYLHYIGEPKDSFSIDEIQTNSDRFLNMTRPLRPDDYYDYEFQDDKPVVFPPRRLFKKPKTDQQKGLDQKMTTAEATNDNSDSSNGDDNNSFINSLFGNLEIVSKPLNVNYTVGQSLYDQLNLAKTPLRAAMCNDNNK